LIVSLKELAEPAEAESEDEPERPRAPSSKRARTRAVAARRRELAVAGLAAATLVTVALLGAFKAYRIPTPSMEPALHCAKAKAVFRYWPLDRVGRP
jgi:hypothetical protein